MKMDNSVGNFSSRQLGRLLAEASGAGGGDLPQRPSPQPARVLDDEPSPFGAGDIIGDFEILRQIGLGGMCFVYQGRQLSLKRMVALKVLRPSVARSPSVARRFQRETILSANLSHPNIVPIFSHGRTPEPGLLPYFTMEFVPGITIQDKVDADGPVDPAQAARIALEACEALDYAHQCNVIHRDVTPRNIVLQDEAERVRLVDFGIAQDTTGRLARTTQTEGLYFGTVAFMSPEQNLGGKLDRRTDIFSLGMTLYFMLTGRTAYRAANRAELALAFKLQHPPQPSDCRPAAPPELSRIVMKMIRTDRNKRYADCSAVAADLRAYLVGAGKTVSAPGRLRRRPNPVVRGMVLAASLAVIALSVYVWANLLGAIAPSDISQPPRQNESGILPTRLTAGRIVLAGAEDNRSRRGNEDETEKTLIRPLQPRKKPTQTGAAARMTSQADHVRQTAVNYRNELCKPKAPDRPFVTSLYHSLLHRDSRPGELDIMQARLAGGRSRTRIALQILTSKDYKDRKTSDREFVRDVHQALLGREPTSAEMKMFLAFLGKSQRRDVVATMLLSARGYSVSFPSSPVSSPW